MMSTTRPCGTCLLSQHLLKQEDHEFKLSLDYKARSCLKKEGREEGRKMLKTVEEDP
jgi:hypothetical protein